MTASATAKAATLWEFDPAALPAVALEGLALAGFELADPAHYDPARGAMGCVLIREIGTENTRWIGLNCLQWAENPVAVLHELLCAGCHRPIIDEPWKAWQIARGHGRMVSVRNYHPACAPSRSGTSPA